MWHSVSQMGEPLTRVFLLKELKSQKDGEHRVFVCEAGSASTYMYTTECDRHLGIFF